MPDQSKPFESPEEKAALILAVKDFVLKWQGRSISTAKDQEEYCKISVEMFCSMYNTITKNLTQQNT